MSIAERVEAMNDKRVKDVINADAMLSSLPDTFLRQAAEAFDYLRHILAGAQPILPAGPLDVRISLGQVFYSDTLTSLAAPVAPSLYGTPQKLTLRTPRNLGSAPRYRFIGTHMLQVNNVGQSPWESAVVILQGSAPGPGQTLLPMRAVAASERCAGLFRPDVDGAAGCNVAIRAARVREYWELSTLFYAGVSPQQSELWASNITGSTIASLATYVDIHGFWLQFPDATTAQAFDRVIQSLAAQPIDPITAPLSDILPKLKKLA